MLKNAKKVVFMYEQVLEVTPFAHKAFQEQLVIHQMRYESFLYWLNNTMGVMLT